MSDFALVQSEAAEFSVRRLCRLLGVSSSGYYAWRLREPCGRCRAEWRLVTKVRAIRAEIGGVYGSRRMTALR